MADKLPHNFMSVSKKVFEKEPDLKQKLEKVMGRVADSIVKDKYVDDEVPVNGKDKKENGQN
ncbi:hypothetical protein [Maridesulfovibrio sp.]|uniref:hypothetical protein n=1 Tax=Maridesulfovibrio sp. TaxID=2795000 RepID=UPI0029CAAA01|nr:hypothetical protein [Maridesulfovibrio sp.]